MSGGLPTYSDTIDSGIPLLGHLPNHWQLRSLGSLTSARSERNRADLPLLSVVRERGVIPRSLMSLSENRNFVPDDLSNYKVVREGDLVINKMKAWQGSLGVAPMEGIVSPAYFVFGLALANRRYGERLLRSNSYVAFFARASDGVRTAQWDLSIDGMKRIPVPVPPATEQAAIVRFLDHADRRIRRAIRAKQKLIALLNEQKQAVIHRAVTRGFDPNVRLKPSGVDWLGDVPEHWEARRITACIEDKRAGLWGEEPSGENVDEHIVCVRVADFDMSTLRVGPAKLTTRAVPRRSAVSRLLAPGDLLIEKSGGGDAEPVGRAVLFHLPGSAICSNFVTRLRPNRQVVLSEWLLHVLWLLQSTRRNVPYIKQTTGIQNLDERAYFSVEIPVPPLKEQELILRHVNAYEQSQRALLDATRRETNLHREYRTRLIADVVTGKVDVRDAAASLPDEVDEPEPLDEVDADEPEQTDREEPEPVEA